MVEALNIVLRLIADWKVEQRLVHLLLIALVTKCTRHAVLEKFLTSWISLFVRSAFSRHAFEAKTGQSPVCHSASRWWSKFEVINQAHASIIREGLPKAAAWNIVNDLQ